MTIHSLIDRVAELLSGDFDPYSGARPTDSDILASVDDAMVEIGRLAYVVDPLVSFTPAANTMAYDLQGSAFSKKVVEAYKVLWDGAMLKGANGEPGLFSREEMDRLYPTWRTDDAGTPLRAFVSGRNLYLHPKPSSDAVSGNSGAYLDAQVYPTKPSSVESDEREDTEIDLPEELHECLAKLAAAKQASPNVTESHQQNVIDRWMQEAYSKAESVGKGNRNQDPWGSTYGGDGGFSEWMAI
jgi:hypothetical protein